MEFYGTVSTGATTKLGDEQGFFKGKRGFVKVRVTKNYL